MAMTKIRGNTQILEKSITSAQLADDAAIKLGQLKRGADVILRDGSVAMTANFDAGSFKLVNLAAGTADSDAATMAQLNAAIAALPDPMEFKGAFPDTVPAKIDNGDAFIVTSEKTVGGVLVRPGQMLIATSNKLADVTMADFVIVDRQDQVLSVAGRMGNVTLTLADLTGITATAAEVNFLSGVTSSVQAQLDAKLDDSQLITDNTLVGVDDADIASALAVKTYVDREDLATRKTVAANKTAIETALAGEVTRATGVEAALRSELDATQVGAGLGTDGAYTAKADANFIAAATSLFDADVKLDAAIKAEESARITADSNLNTRVTTVEGQVNGKIGDLTTLTTTEKGTIVGAINELDADLAAEITRATGAESTLTTNLAAEVTRATDAEATLQSNINAEAAARAAADGDLTTLTTTAKGNLVAAINELDSDLAAEVSRATTAEAGLQSALDAEVATRIADVDAEETRALAAEKAIADDLAAYKTANDAALAQEVSDRIAGDAAVQSALDAYKTSNDAALAAEVAARIADVDAEETRALAAEAALDAKIDSSMAALHVHVDGEVTLDIIDGVNTDFKLAFVPVAGSVKPYLNGIRQRAGATEDFVVVAGAVSELLNVVRFNIAPASGDTLIFDYRK